MSRRWRSRGLPWRLRLTAVLALTRSPISCASLKLRGSTTWTLAALVGTVRTTGGRGTDTPDGGSSRGRARRLAVPVGRDTRWGCPDRSDVAGLGLAPAADVGVLGSSARVRLGVG